MEFDHFTPFSFTQCDNYENIVASCKDCNRKKFDKIFESIEDVRYYVKTGELRNGNLSDMWKAFSQAKSETNLLPSKMSSQKLERSTSKDEKYRKDLSCDAFEIYEKDNYLRIVDNRGLAIITKEGIKYE